MTYIPITTNGETIMVPRPIFSLILKFPSRRSFTFNLPTIPANIASLTFIIGRAEVNVTNLPLSMKKLSVEGARVHTIRQLDLPTSITFLRLQAVPPQQGRKKNYDVTLHMPVSG